MIDKFSVIDYNESVEKWLGLFRIGLNLFHLTACVAAQAVIS